MIAVEFTYDELVTISGALYGRLLELAASARRARIVRETPLPTITGQKKRARHRKKLADELRSVRRARAKVLAKFRELRRAECPTETPGAAPSRPASNETDPS